MVSLEPLDRKELVVLLVYLVSRETRGFRVSLDKTAPQDHPESQDATVPREREDLMAVLVSLACRVHLGSLDSKG